MAARANKKAEIGVPRDPEADTQVQPTISDIGVPVEGLVAPDNLPGDPTHKRQDTDPAHRQAEARGVGVKLNPNTGVETT